LDSQQVRELFFEQLEHLSPEAEYELRHPDYVMEMPQSGERIRGREKMRAFQEAYPNPPTIEPRRVVGSGDVWVIEARSDYGGGQRFNLAMIVEFRDGKIWKDTRYYAEPFEPPAWRSQWVEPMGETAT
jgi:ketosteroid isomerase-like protein